MLPKSCCLFKFPVKPNTEQKAKEQQRPKDKLPTPNKTQNIYSKHRSQLLDLSSASLFIIFSPNITPQNKRHTLNPSQTINNKIFTPTARTKSNRIYLHLSSIPPISKFYVLTPTTTNLFTSQFLIPSLQFSSVNPHKNIITVRESYPYRHRGGVLFCQKGLTRASGRDAKNNNKEKNVTVPSCIAFSRSAHSSGVLLW